MFARVTTLTLKPDTTNQVSRIFRDSVVPAASKLMGFRGAFFLEDAASNRAIAIALWDSRANLDAGDSSGFYREQLAKSAHFVTEEPRREVYEVSVRDQAVRAHTD